MCGLSGFAFFSHIPEGADFLGAGGGAEAEAEGGVEHNFFFNFLCNFYLKHFSF
jgi:hypothetical protein